MTSEGQLSLSPERSDQCGSPLHGLEWVASELADFGNAVQAKVGDLAFLELGPDRPDRIEFGRAQEFDDLLGADGTREKADVEVPEGQTGNGRELFSGEAVLEYWRMPAQAPGARDARALAQSAFVDEDNGAASSDGFF